MRKNHVKVNIYDDCDVDCEVANVSIAEEDEVEWYSTGPAFTVDFGRYSPFDDLTFDVPAGKSRSSGPARKDAPEVTYHYKIRRAGSQMMAADPDVNVKH
jgi:hypothetical protein